MNKLIIKAQEGAKSRYNKNNSEMKHLSDWHKDNWHEFVSMIPFVGDRRGRRSFSLSNVGDAGTDACAQWSNGYLRSLGYKTSGNAWGLSHVKPVASGYTTSAPDTEDFLEMNRYNWDAADNLKNSFNYDNLDKSKVYAVNLYSTGSPYQREAFYNGTSGHGSHTGNLRYEDGLWNMYHNWHGTVKKTPIDNVWGSNNEIGITSIYLPTKKFGGTIHEIDYFSPLFNAFFKHGS